MRNPTVRGTPTNLGRPESVYNEDECYLEEIGSHSLKVVHGAAVLILIQH